MGNFFFLASSMQHATLAASTGGFSGQQCGTSCLLEAEGIQPHRNGRTCQSIFFDELKIPRPRIADAGVCYLFDLVQVMGSETVTE